MRRLLAAASTAALLCASATAFAAPAPAHPAHGSSAAQINAIADEGFNRGEVMEIDEHLSDQIGGRMTNSPAMRQAEAWTQAKFKEWGLSNVHKEGFDFGRGWWIESAHVRMVAPRPVELKAIPVAWTPPTKGAVTAPIVVAPLRKESDFAEWKGKLSGKIVLTSYPAPPKDATEPAFKRFSDAEIAKMNTYEQPSYDPASATRMVERRAFAKKRDAFLASEGAVAWVQMSRTEGRLVHGEGGAYRVGQTPALPAIELAAEDYRKLARLAKLGEVKIEMDDNVHFDDSDRNAYDVLAEIPGSDPNAGFVMAGAHLDSWVAGDGAADNGAGAAVVMEAARILSAMHAKPRRTIRFALWAGEEQGLLGSYAWIDKHLAHRPPPTDPAQAELGPYFASNTYPIEKKPEFDQLAGYFNLDNGSGKIRGIYTEGNFAVVPQLREWLAPFSSLGATAVVAAPTGATDHVFMARMGLPAYQFIQDPLDYESVVHHTDLDVYDHLRPEDMRQAAVVMAAVLLQAADSDTPLPRNVTPTQPRPTDPFRYKDPAEN